VVVTLAAVASFWRLFVDLSFLGPLAVIALVAHGVAIGTRRRGWSLAAAGGASSVTMVLVLTWVLYARTTAAGLPTPATLKQVDVDVDVAWLAFQDVVAPTEVVPGFVLVAGLAVWAAVFIADWAAFRLWVPLEAMIPAGTLFVFASLFGSSKQRGAATILFAAAVLGFALVHRVARQQSDTGWLARDVDRGSRALLRVGAGLAVISVVGAALVGPVLPGADAEPLLAWRDLGAGPDSRRTVSPLVEIRGRLVSQSSTELFTVRSDIRAYWRLTALDTFDGDVWSSTGDYPEADGALPGGVDSRAATTLARQRFDISQLAAIWLPAAYEPRAVASEQFDVLYDPDSSTLIVDDQRDDSDGASYVVESALPQLTRAELAPVPAQVPSDIAERYLGLPESLSLRVAALARDVAGQQDTPYATARALQDWFRTNFTYDLEGVPGGHGTSAIEEFLFEARRGYCEQFAGSFAAMARTLGLPSRVAVGFTPGEVDPADPTLYHVRGLHAHAWPEVYVAGYGWVPFEPTPGRGIPGALDYTGVPDQQADSANPGTATTLAPSPVTEPAPVEGPTPSTTPVPDDPGAGATTAAGEGDDPSIWSTWLPRALIAASLALAVLAAAAVGVPLARSARRRLRRARAVTPTERVRVAWAEGAESLRVLALTRRADETPTEFAARARPALGSEIYDGLAASVVTAEYSAAGVDEAEGDAALALAARIDGEVRGRATRQQRLRDLYDPRRGRRSRRGPLAWRRRRANRRPGPAPGGATLELLDR